VSYYFGEISEGVRKATGRPTAPGTTWCARWPRDEGTIHFRNWRFWTNPKWQTARRMRWL